MSFTKDIEYDIGTGVGEYDIDRAYYPDAHVIAENVLASLDPKAKQIKSLPTKEELTRAITGITLTCSIRAVNQLQVVVADPEWKFMDSGIFDTDENGQLDPIDLRYPEGGRWWWRLSQISPSADSRDVTLTFLDREVFPLMSLMGPIKADRAKMTRAQFMAMLAAKVHTPEPIEFYSRELDVKQPIAGSSASSSSSGSTSAASSTKPSSAQPAGQASKSSGIGANATGLTAKGQTLNSTQIGVANRLLAQAAKDGANPVATAGLIFDAIFESDLGVDTASNGAYGGVLGGSVSIFAPDLSSLEAEAHSALIGGNGYTGLIGLSKQSNDVAWVGSQCTRAVPFDSHGYSTQYESQNVPGGLATVVAEATKIVGVGGGGLAAASSSSSTSVIQPYYFEVGVNESYWSAMTRLAQEVNGELFWDGNRLYYDDEQTLILQKVARVIHRDNPIVVTWSYTWDVRQIATQMSLTLIGGMFDYFAGEVLQLEGFGSASSGSSASPAKRPGCWLVQDVTRNKGDFSSVLTLVQPDLPKLEPAPQVKSVSASAASGVIATSQSVMAAIQAAKKLGAMMLPYSIADRTLQRVPPSSGYDCSAGVSWVLLSAGFVLPNNATWGDWAPVSGDFTSWGDPGRGTEMTIWTSSFHIFIEFNVPGVGHMSFDSGHPSSAHAWYAPFYDQSYTQPGSGFVPRHWPTLPGSKSSSGAPAASSIPPGFVTPRMNGSRA